MHQRPGRTHTSDPAEHALAFRQEMHQVRGGVLTGLGSYVPRFVDAALEEMLGEMPAVMINGPRGCGKTTTARQLAETEVHLDEPRQAAAFRAAPDAALAALTPPVLLDEWQEVPEVLAAVKRAVDSGGAPGRFVLTGSVRGRMTGHTWPATGRITPLSMYGFTVAEMQGVLEGRHFVDRLFDRQLQVAPVLNDAPDVPEYVDLALQSGFPEAMRLSGRTRSRWFAGYVDNTVWRDASSIAEVRAPDRLLACLRAVAACVGSTPSETTLAEAAKIDVRTVRSYLDLLEDLRIVERLASWQHSRLNRLVKRPKLHLVEPALLAHLLGVDARGFILDGHLLGQLLESFVVAQLRPLLGLGEVRIEMTHLRDRGGEHEVDIILESPAGEVVGVEVKAAPRAEPRDAKHLSWLRDQFKTKFVRGVVLTTGVVAESLGDRLISLPISAIWTPEALA